MPSIILMTVGMAILARASGGGIVKLPSMLGWLPEATFGLSFGFAVFLYHGTLLGLLAGAWSYIWMQTGHGTAFSMGERPQDAQSGRKQFLSPVVDWVCAKLRQPLGGAFYCWLFMGLKGLLIGLPVAPAGLLLGILWPLAYFIGRKVKISALCELLSGACAGLVIWLHLQ